MKLHGLGVAHSCLQWTCTVAQHDFINETEQKRKYTHQGALGYEIIQTKIVRRNEGVHINMAHVMH
jgi:hypothetical protein